MSNRPWTRLEVQGPMRDGGHRLVGHHAGGSSFVIADFPATHEGRTAHALADCYNAAGAASAALSPDPTAARAVIDAARRLVDVGRHNDAEWDAFCAVVAATPAGTERSGTDG